MFRKYLPIIALSIVVASAFVNSGLRADDKCFSHMTVQYFGTQSEEYTACDREMRTTYNWYASDYSGYKNVWCKVENTTFSQIYHASETSGASGQIVEWTHCTGLTEHKLSMDIEPIIDPPPYRGFVYPTSFTADYFAEKPE